MHIAVGQGGDHLHIRVNVKEQLQEALDGDVGNFGVEHFFIPHARVGSHAETLGGFADGNAVEVGGFQQQGGGVVLDFGVQTAHDASDGDRFALAADHEGVLVDIPLIAIEGLEGEGRVEASDFDAVHLAPVEGVHMLPKLHHEVVGEVGKQIDGAASAVEKADAHIDRTGVYGDIVHLHAGIAIAVLRILNIDGNGGQFTVDRGVHAVDRLQRTSGEGGKFPCNAVVTPEVGAVGEGLVVHLKDGVLDSIDRFEVGAKGIVVGDLHNAGIVGGNAEFRFRAAHAVGVVARDSRFADGKAVDAAALLGKGDLHALADIGRAADAVVHLIARVHLQQMELFGIGMIFDGENLCNDDIACLSAVMEHFLDLGGGKCKSVNQRVNVETVQIDKIANPVH